MDDDSASTLGILVCIWKAKIAVPLGKSAGEARPDVPRTRPDRRE